MSPSRNCKFVHRYLHFAPLTNMMVIMTFFAHLSIMLSSHAPIFDTSILRFSILDANGAIIRIMYQNINRQDRFRILQCVGLPTSN